MCFLFIAPSGLSYPVVFFHFAPSDGTLGLVGRGTRGKRVKDDTVASVIRAERSSRHGVESGWITPLRSAAVRRYRHPEQN